MSRRIGIAKIEMIPNPTQLQQEDLLLLMINATRDMLLRKQHQQGKVTCFRKGPNSPSLFHNHTHKEDPSYISVCDVCVSSRFE